jgi:hypothetical protein
VIDEFPPDLTPKDVLIIMAVWVLVAVVALVVMYRWWLR